MFTSKKMSYAKMKNEETTGKDKSIKCKAKVICLFSCVCILLIYLLYKQDRNTTQPIDRRIVDWIPYNKRNETKHVKDEGQDVKKPDKGIKPYNAVTHYRLNEVISEKEALTFGPCKDANLAANSEISTLKLLDSHDRIYSIGEKIYVMATLFDSYGRNKTSGGDQLRATISNKVLNASAPGVVFDHGNGSYTIIFEALWSGSALIRVTIAYTREAITALYRMMVEGECFRNILAQYKKGNVEEEAVCHTDHKRLLRLFKYKDVCNFSALISGMPWFCGKPQDRRIECRDWRFVKFQIPELHDTVSECENELLAGSKHHQAISETITVTARSYTPNDGKIRKYYQPSIPCLKYNVTKLWLRKFTTGFYYNGKWRLRHCKEFHDFNFDECLMNKRLYLFGDSTVRQWYEVMLNRYNCIQFTEKWAYKKWKRPSGCKCASNNLTVSLAIHSQPFYTSQNWSDKTHTLVSVPSRLEKIKTEEDAILLIHIFLHTLPFHHRYFSLKMKKIRGSIEKLLQRNKKVRVFIKMPHTFTLTNKLIRRNNDFFGFVFTRIIVNTFKGLYHTRRVVPLDNKDATMSITSGPIHPNRGIVESMVNQMFSYICE